MFIKRRYKVSDNLSARKIFAFHITNKGGRFRIFKSSYNLIREIQATWFQKKTTCLKDMKRTQEKQLTSFVIRKMQIKATSNRLSAIKVWYQWLEKLYSSENSLHPASKSISGRNHLGNNLALYSKIKDVISPHLTTQRFHS